VQRARLLVDSRWTLESEGIAMPKSMGEARLGHAPELSEITWTFRIDGRRIEWDWGQGPPDIRLLKRSRRPSSADTSRHIPVRAYCETVRDHVELESGLEHDLLRVLDRDPSVVWLLAQPLELRWVGGGTRGPRRHTPDLASLDADGVITIWDVKKPASAASDRFVGDSSVTRLACDQRGWRYEVFTGLDSVHRHNLLWLHSYRRPPAWTWRHEDELLAVAAGGVLLGELLLVADDAERAAVLWHLIWTGRLVVDLAKRFSPETEVAA